MEDTESGTLIEKGLLLATFIIILQQKTNCTAYNRSLNLYKLSKTCDWKLY
jgi:hypothetical protein